MSRAILTAILTAVLLPLLVSAAAATQITLVYDALQVVVQSSAGVLPLDQGVAVADQVLFKVQRPVHQPGLTLVYLNGQPALVSNDREPRLNLNTRTLPDGQHKLSIETQDVEGVRLASASTILLNVANAPGALQEQIAATALKPAPVFQIIYRRVIPREIVWFNGREGDLERHGFRRSGQIYITAADLFRHIGGTIVWGPTHNWIELHRNDLTIRVIPGSRRVYVNGQARSLAAPALRIDQRTFVPVQSLCEVLGLPTHWNTDEDRLYVSFRR
ncbi:MAG: copper amine oxidase N-terminal domain-containing protein [candidate division WS1 bacterium]|nr:copper amine oxidase N-terminal domain-containing protein [candidate division WS1 bacterium]